MSAVCEVTNHEMTDITPAIVREAQDDKDIFRLTVLLEVDCSPEKGNMRREDGTTKKATERTTEKLRK